MGKKKPHEHSQKALEVSVSEAGLKILAPILIATALSLWGIKVSGVSSYNQISRTQRFNRTTMCNS